MISVWADSFVLNSCLLVSLVAEGSFDLFEDELERDSFGQLAESFILKWAYDKHIILSIVNELGDSSPWIWLRTILIIFPVVWMDPLHIYLAGIVKGKRRPWWRSVQLLQCSFYWSYFVFNECLLLCLIIAVGFFIYSYKLHLVFFFNKTIFHHKMTVCPRRKFFGPSEFREFIVR